MFQCRFGAICVRLTIFQPMARWFGSYAKRDRDPSLDFVLCILKIYTYSSNVLLQLGFNWFCSCSALLCGCVCVGVFFFSFPQQLLLSLRRTHTKILRSSSDCNAFSPRFGCGRAKTGQEIK